MTKNISRASRIATFRTLHESGCFMLPNPWDKGSAVYLEHLGFAAVATTSAGFAFSRGLPDSVSALSLDEMIAHISDVVEATNLPVNADFQNCYAHQPEEVGTNVALCIETGVAGLSIEDSNGDDENPLYDFDLAVRRVRAAREAIDASGVPVVLTARCEAWLVGDPQPAKVSLKRLVAFADEGADCLYAPGVTDPHEISAIVEAVSPKPVNVLVSSSNPQLSLQRLTDLGVRRISVGGALARVAWGAFMRAAQSIKETGTFEAFDEAARFDEIQELFMKR